MHAIYAYNKDVPFLHHEHCITSPNVILFIWLVEVYCFLSWALTVDGAATNSLKENSVSSFEMIDGEEGFDLPKEHTSGMFNYVI